MKHETKADFVHRILSLGEDTQLYLMKELQSIENQTESHLNVKEIYSKIEELEDENESLS